MRYLTHLIIFSLLCAVVLLSGCSASRRAFSKGERFEAEGRFEEAMYSYADAFREDPETSAYRVRFLKARDTAAQQHFRQGSELYEQGDYVAALAEFQSAHGLDPTQARFRQQVEATTRLKDAQLAFQEGIDFEKGNKLKDAARVLAKALELNPDNREYQAAMARVSGMRKGKLEGFELSLKSARPITLKFKDAKLKDVFNIVTQLSGINFIFDETVKDQPVTIYLENATFQQSLDLLTNMFKLGRKVANESTVIIYPRTPDKIKQYEEMVLRTFHLNYMDAKKAVNLIRTMLQVRKIYVNEDSNSVVVRDTADVVEVVDKILDANDVPDAEVILDVEVIEVSNTNTQRLGLLLSDYSVKLGAFSPGGNLMSSNSLTSATTTIPSGSTAATSTVTIDNLIRAFSIKGHGGFVTVPNATYNFGKTLTKGEVLSNPKIRVKNKEKSKFTVGTRVPITTSNTTNQTVSVNVQYVDIGVKLNAEPNIQLNNDVVIKLSLEVSQQVGSPRDVGGGTTVVTIGTRNVETVLSLKDGETSIIGGLIQHTTGDTRNKLLFLSDIPLIGSFFTDTQSSRDKNELLLAITPRLVRGVTVPQAGLMSFASGKEDDPSLVRPLASFEQEPLFEAAPKVGERPAPTQPTLPAAPAVPAVPAVPAAPPSPPAAARPAAVAPSPAVQRGVLQIGAPSATSIGRQFTLEVRVSDVVELGAAPLALTYDPAIMEFVSAAPGAFLGRDGKPTQFSARPDASAGTVTINLARGAGAGGVSGSGTLFSAMFRARRQGTAGFGFSNVNFTAADGRPLSLLPFSTAVEVK